MKKKKWIAVLLIFGLLAVLFTPIPAGELRDGGTKVYRALTYTLVNWHRVCAEPDGIYEALRVYPFPDSMRTVSELWELEQSRVPDLRETEFCAQIKKINGTSILVEGQENTGSAFRGEIVLSISEETVIQSEQKSLSTDALQVGDWIRVTCGGVSLTIYPPIMPYIYRVEVIDPVPESIFVHRDSYPAKAIRVDSTGDHGSFCQSLCR